MSKRLLLTIITIVSLSITEHHAFIGRLFRNSRQNQRIRPGFYYEVKKGDNLWALSQRYNVSVERLKRINNIKDGILPIKTIYIPRGIKNEKSARNHNQKPPSKTPSPKFTDSAPKKTTANTARTQTIRTQNQNKQLNWPVKKPKLAAGGNFGRRSDGTTNTGIQLAVNSGTAVQAAQSGKVVYAAELKGYGKTVIIDHEDNYFTVYSHLGSIRPLKSGDSLKSGQLIGNTGMSGSVSAPILHFEVRHLNEAKDPLLFLDRKVLR